MKGLRALKELGKIIPYAYITDEYKIVKKELKVLEIIKSKLVGEFKLVEHNGHYCIKFYFDDGNDGTMSLDFFITKKEYDLLKEVLK